MVKNHATMMATLEQVYESILDFDRRRVYDSSFDCGHQVKNLTNTMGIGYLRTKKVMMVSGRELYMLGT